MNRHEFITALTGGVLWTITGNGGITPVKAESLQRASNMAKTKLSLIKTSDRASGIKRAINFLGPWNIAARGD